MATRWRTMIGPIFNIGPSGSIHSQGAKIVPMTT